MSIVIDKLRKYVEARKEFAVEKILSGVNEPNTYHRLCGQHHELLSLERELREIITDLQIEDEKEDD